MHSKAMISNLWNIPLACVWLVVCLSFYVHGSLSVCLSINLFIWLCLCHLNGPYDESISPSFWISRYFYVYDCVSICLPVYQTVCIPFCLFVCVILMVIRMKVLSPSVWLSVYFYSYYCLSVCMCIRLSACLLICLFVSPSL